jgi:hypothetical protein
MAWQTRVTMLIAVDDMWLGLLGQPAYEGARGRPAARRA